LATPLIRFRSGLAAPRRGIGGYFALSHPGGALADRDIEGRSVEIHASLRHPFVRSRSASIWGGIDLRVRDASQELGGIKVRDDRLTILGGNLIASQQFSSTRLRGRLLVAQGLDLIDATEEGDPLASRVDASAVFTKLEAWGELEHAFSRQWGVALQAEGQIADGPLLSSEEMGLGGKSFGPGVGLSRIFRRPRNCGLGRSFASTSRSCRGRSG
jgi:hemolysin activation/secretion protein